MLSNEMIKQAAFSDPDDQFQARLVEAIQVEVATMRADPESHKIAPLKLETEGGWTVRSNRFWDSADGTFLMNTVSQFVSHICSQPVVHIRDRWANVMEASKGWYSAPHSHSNADIAVVYQFSGDVSDTPKGRLQLIDPRLPGCCPRPEYVTAALTPKMKAGGVIAFPGFITHWVSPYIGSQDRITLAFNVGFGPPTNLPNRDLEEIVDLGRKQINS
jgi:hypothetical protein